MQSITLLAASFDGGNVSPDGCHTPVGKRFLGGGRVMRNLRRITEYMWRLIHELQKSWDFYLFTF